MILLLIFSGLSLSHAQVSKTNLYRKPVAPVEQPVVTKVELKSPARKARSSAPRDISGNLPQDYQRYSMAQYRATESPVVLPTSVRRVSFRALPLGTIVNAEISGNIIAFPDSKVPIRATVRAGAFKGAVFLGEAQLERNSKRIGIEFRKFRPATDEVGYSLIASGMSQDGSLGLEGKYHSGEAKYFSAEFLAAFAAGYADSLVERSTTPFGQTVDAPNASNAGKKAVAGAMSRTADRFAEKVRMAPEFVTLEGPTAIQILIQDQPTLQN